VGGVVVGDLNQGLFDILDLDVAVPLDSLLSHNADG